MDRVKEELALLRVLLVLSLATDITVIGWLAQNYATVHTALLAMAAFAMLCVNGIVWIIGRAIANRLNQMEN